MTLIVEVPPGRAAERQYAIGTVLGEWLGLDHEIVDGEPGVVRIRVRPATAADADGAPSLTMPDVLFATADADWLTERSMPGGPLPRVGDDLPVLFGRPAPDGRAWSRHDGGIDVVADVFGTAFFLLTRYEEVVRRATDHHGRFPAAASIAAAEGVLDRPLVDDWVDELWAAIHALWPALARRETAFRVRLTHDVDEPWATVGRSTGEILHALAGDVVRRRDVDLAARRLRAAVDVRRGRTDRDPADTFDLLMATSEAHGLRSTFYVLAGNQPGEPDFRYRVVHPRILALLGRIHDRGHKVGLHASYLSHGDPDRLLLEAEALRAACRAAGFDQPTYGVRQHYLRFEAPASWRAHEAAGFEHDSTLGWAEAVGYRAGTSREFTVFDVEAGRPLRLRQRPLVVMDVTMLGYLGLTPEAAGSLARSVLEPARRHGGDGVILYHNNTLASGRVKRHYVDLVDAVAGPSSPAGAGAGGHRFVEAGGSEHGSGAIDS